MDLFFSFFIRKYLIAVNLNQKILF
jgi:hypothetical protein